MARTVGVLLCCILLQVVFAVIIPIVTSTRLFISGTCLLNQKGNVCTFAYVTSGISILFTCLVAIGAVGTLRALRIAPATSFLPADTGSVSAFAGFWWLVAAVTFTQRGKQASQAGLPRESARDAVAALAWLEFILFLLASLAVAYDRLRCAWRLARSAAAAERLLAHEPKAQSVTPRSAASPHAQTQFKQVTCGLAVAAASPRAGAGKAAEPALAAAV